MADKMNPTDPKSQQYSVYTWMGDSNINCPCCENLFAKGIKDF